ncbi:MAG TPA: DUF2804 domain-containing protein [Kofleriaceae bacterium]|nr:DUF2804 domain-containing protein [Kofleriaceae bacterium]
MKPAVVPAPRSVIDRLVERRATEPHIGAWDQPLDNPNIEDAQIAHALDRFAGMPAIGRVEQLYRQKLRLKSWQYMTAVTDDLFIAFVVGTAGFASNGFVYAAELPSGRVHKRFAITPLMKGTKLAHSSTAAAHLFHARNLSVAIENRGRAFSAHIDARTEAKDKLRAQLEFDSEPADDHLAVCVPLPDGRWNYTHKFAAFSVTGHVTIGDRRIDFARDRSFGTMDFSKMFALRHAVWRWIALSGKTDSGKRVGINLVDPTPGAPISENALWLDGKRHALTNVQVAQDLTSARADGLELEMSDVAEVAQRLDLPLVRHRLRHVVGAFRAKFSTSSGARENITRAVGIAEDYDTWW